MCPLRWVGSVVDGCWCVYRELGVWGGGGEGTNLRLVGSEVDRSTGRIRDMARTVQNEQKTK